MLSIDEMVASYGPDKSRPYRVLVGFEMEVFLFDQRLTPLTYRGSSARDVSQGSADESPGLEEIFAWTAKQLQGRLYPGLPPRKMLLADGAQISLEPGGQFEFASAPVGSFAEVMQQLRFFLDLLQRLEERFGLHVFFGGVSPVHTPEQIGLVIPSERYQLMDAYFTQSGTMGQRMMRQSTSLQVTFDYRDAKLGQRLLRASQFVAPMVAGLFCHSPYIDGRKTEHRSNRVPIWANTDPARCGMLPGFSDENYSFEDYVRHVNRAPMLFVETADGLFDAEGTTFEAFNRDGYRGHTATVDDFLLHGSTIFTDVRLKQTVEVRTIDGQDPALVPSALALLCGLLVCESARALTLEALRPLICDCFDQVTDRVSRQGLTAPVCGKSARDLGLELIELARRGLGNCFPKEDVASHLEPLAALVDAGKTPADVVIERFGDDPQAWLAAGGTFPAV